MKLWDIETVKKVIVLNIKCIASWTFENFSFIKNYQKLLLVS